MNNNAPIVLFAYKRLKHLKQTIQSLENNTGIEKTELFVFCDAAKDENDKKSVDSVKEFLCSYTDNSRFLKCSIHFSNNHNGLATSVITGVTKVINLCGKVIVVEDDLELSHRFFEYMNGALSYFEGDDSIWAISGYTPNLSSLTNYRRSLFLSYSPCSWGWATWKDRWNSVDWSVSSYKWDRFNPLYHLRMSRGGNLLPSMLRAQMCGNLDSWFIRWCYFANKYDKKTVYSKESLVKNIGLDTTGTHCHEDILEKYNVNLLHHTNGINYNDCEFNKVVQREYHDFQSMSMVNRLKEKINCQ